MFDLNQHIEDEFLVGVYRPDKPHLSWILKNKMYNVRSQSDLFVRREGCVTYHYVPKFVLIFNAQTFDDVRVFECIGSVERTQSEMQKLEYPEPNGSYITYLLRNQYAMPALDVMTLLLHRGFERNAEHKIDISPLIVRGLELSQYVKTEMSNKSEAPDRVINFIDLFAGLGGFHQAVNKWADEHGLSANCVFVSELREDLRILYSENFGVPADRINADITQLNTDEKILSAVPEHELLCAGFPCQPFSKAGKRQGFQDEAGRGILFNYIEAILRLRHPKYILLENVSNLENHDGGNTWRVIKEKLEALNYDVDEKVLSPHEFGIPQHRKRIYIVGVYKFADPNKEIDLQGFSFPTPTNGECDIKSIIEKKPKEYQPVPEKIKKELDVWQEFVDLCIKHTGNVPPSPLWTMEFGATYEFEGIAPANQSYEQLIGKRGDRGQLITGSTQEECVLQLPKYARTKQTRELPDWKKGFIRRNREFYEANKVWIDSWLPKTYGWENSHVKLEWNCTLDNGTKLVDKIIQFRPSGVRVKRPTYSPALTYMGSQTPLFLWANGGRYMTITEGSRLQGMTNIKFNGLKKSRIFEALGNAVNVDVVKLVLENLLKL